MSVINSPRFLTTEQAAERLGIAPQTLALWRCTRRYSIPYVKLGRKVGYRLEDLDRWLESRRVGAVAEAVPA